MQLRSENIFDHWQFFRNAGVYLSWTCTLRNIVFRRVLGSTKETYETNQFLNFPFDENRRHSYESVGTGLRLEYLLHSSGGGAACFQIRLYKQSEQFSYSSKLGCFRSQDTR